MKPTGRAAGDKEPESIDFVPKRELDQAADPSTAAGDRATQTGSRASAQGIGGSATSQQAAGGAALPRRTKIHPAAARPQAGSPLRSAGVPPDPFACRSEERRVRKE